MRDATVRAVRGYGDEVSATNKRHFALFVAEAEACIKRWRIVGWRVEFLHEKLTESRAEIRTSAKNHAAVIVLNTEWDHDEVTDKKVRESARHEAVHLLVDELDEIAQFRYVTNDQRVHALESVVRHLDELLP